MEGSVADGNGDRVVRELLSDELVFPESPRWHDGRLWFSDPFAGRLMRADGDGRAHAVVSFDDDTPSGLGFLPDGAPLLALMRSRRVVRIESTGPVLHADLAELSGRINDMVVGGDGRAFVGCGTPVDSGSGGVIVIEPDGSFRLAATGIPRPNGLVLTADRRTLIYAASDERVLIRMAVEPDGSLGEAEEHADLGGRMPDGICLDAEGAIWAGALGDGFVRCAPDGAILETLATGAGRLDVACVLGGADRRTLFMASAITTFEDLAAGRGHTAKGFICSADVEVPGAGWP